MTVSVANNRWIYKLANDDTTAMGEEVFHWMSIESFYHIYRITCGLFMKRKGK